ncbi:hypothetical protein FIU86_04430 [Roseovarius sp. THAF9]|uniref:hypothetical protein n=1 Tax=Roseovarius sp. THAF9 TaxID=2587847 RepID=UPI001268F0F1|nr:hypothetical protein [Roseovarius sp. THAF9]QFT92078.1 hypothetical protein FIU86_04430 [Roseovarius sp. THAF9]
MNEQQESKVRAWFAETIAVYDAWLADDGQVKDRAARTWLRGVQERILAAAKSGSFRRAVEAYSEFCEVLQEVPTEKNQTAAEIPDDHTPATSWAVPQSPSNRELIQAAVRLDDLARTKGKVAVAAGQVMLFAFAPSHSEPLKRRHLLELQRQDRAAALCLIEEAAKRGGKLPNIWRVRRG